MCIIADKTILSLKNRINEEFLQRKYLFDAQKTEMMPLKNPNTEVVFNSRRSNQLIYQIYMKGL